MFEFGILFGGFKLLLLFCVRACFGFPLVNKFDSLDVTLALPVRVLVKGFWLPLKSKPRVGRRSRPRAEEASGLAQGSQYNGDGAVVDDDDDVFWDAGVGGPKRASSCADQEFPSAEACF